MSWTRPWRPGPNEPGPGTQHPAARGHSLVQALATRVLTATILGSFVVAGILYLPVALMTGFFAIAVFVGAVEWALLAGATTWQSRLAYAVITVGLAFAIYLACREFAALNLLLSIGCVWWALASVWVIRYQLRGAPAIHSRMVLGLCGWLVLIPAISAVWLLQEQSPRLLLALFATVWSADILAYIGGKTIGRHRLASRVSPGKTWEGLFVAVAGTLLLAGFAAQLINPAQFAVVIAVVAVTVMAAVVGDLLESLLKRMRGVKDSGALLPGHGGILDRIDSMLAAAPVFTLGFISLGQP